ncbi:TPA: hypothetical protein DDY47_02505 [candidate division WWE3 bacterium]|uniref:Uncharacterized protein n=1 Tax=candidate division WWE3 bacterium TaxID=2053526 RepID=A0A354G444_UNCKA|nr:hypothetical protein [candidate division WWE3 bacterium]
MSGFSCILCKKSTLTNTIRKFLRTLEGFCQSAGTGKMFKLRRLSGAHANKGMKPNQTHL